MAADVKSDGDPRDQPQAGKDGKRPIVVVDLGKRQSRKRVRQLRKGEGKLMPRVETIVDQVLDSPEVGVTAGKPPVIVIVVREKQSARVPWPFA